MPTTAIEALGDLLARPEGSWSLADGALASARLHRPGLDPAQVVGRLDALGASARDAVGAAVHPRFVAAGVGAVFHLTEELVYRQDLQTLPGSDKAHIAGDMKLAYQLLVHQWLDYMEYLKANYPYLFSLAMRTNPFDRQASPIVK